MGKKISYSQTVAYAARLPLSSYARFLMDVTLRRKVLAGIVTIKRPFPGLQVHVVKTPGAKVKDEK
jgi:hypothetical protein